MFNPQPTAYDLSFHFLGFPVRVHPLFWVIAALIGTRGEIGDMKTWLVDLVVWVAAVFVAIMVHELGHGLVFRYVFRVSARIVLHGAGGLAIPLAHRYRKPGFKGFFSEVLLSASGVLAGFALALFVLLFYWTGITHLFGEGALTSLLSLFFTNLVFVCVVWGIFNILPIYPLDGGHIAREVLCSISPRTGVANSLALSIFVAALVAILWIRIGTFFNAALFAYLAFLSWKELERS